MHDLTLAGIGFPTTRPYTYIYFCPPDRELFLEIVAMPLLILEFGRRAPWIYYSRNISTKQTRP